MRYDLAPVEWAAGTRFHLVREQSAPDIGLAERLGVSRQTIHRARRFGLNAYTADQYAVAVGYHPSLLWPSWFEDYEDEERDRRRTSEWWERLDRYRKSVVLEEVA